MEALLATLAQVQEPLTFGCSSTTCRPVSPSLEASTSPRRNVLCPRQGAALKLLCRKRYPVVLPAGLFVHITGIVGCSKETVPRFRWISPSSAKANGDYRRDSHIAQDWPSRSGPGKLCCPPETWANLVVRPHAIEDAGTVWVDEDVCVAQEGEEEGE